MKSRLVTFLALILTSASFVALSSASASAATYSAKLTPAQPIAGEVARITGAVNPAGRTLALQRYVKGRWIKVASTRTTTSGRYAFSVKASATSYAYRSYAPATRIKNRKYGAAYSRTVRVTSVVPSLSFSISTAPVGQSQAGTTNLTPAVATFKPARPNTVVTVQKLVGDTWTSVATARQSSGGTAYPQVPAGTAASPGGTFRAVSRPTTTVPYVVSASVSPTYLTQKWGDEFEGTTLDTSKWQYRPQAPGGRRMCSSTPATGDDGLITVARSVASFKIKKVGVATRKCPNGTFKNSMIAANGLAGFQGQYGVYAARVKFQSARGMHGSFWMQGPPVTGAEIDVAEYFGSGRRDSGLSSFVHYTDAQGRLSTSGGMRSIASILGSGKTPANGWHVYSVEWSPTSYVFRLDGTPVLVTSKPHVATAAEEMILSLLSSDYELPQLKAAELNTTASTMSVDWVRVWQQ